MSGRFEGLTEAQWTLFEPLLPKDSPVSSKGKPHTPWKNVALLRKSFLPKRTHREKTRKSTLFE